MRRLVEKLKLTKGYSFKLMTIWIMAFSAIGVGALLITKAEVPVIYGSRVPKPTPRNFGVAQPVGAVVIMPSDNAAAIISSSLVPKTFWFAPGTHNLSTTIDTWASHTIIGAPGSVINVGSNELAIRANNTPNVTVRGLTFEGGQAQYQRATIECMYATGWLIEGNELRGGRAYGIFTGGGTTVKGNYVHNNGQGGVKNWAPDPKNTNTIVIGNEISSNNTSKQNPFWEAGGFKSVDSSNITISGNYFHDNWGWGVWFDYAPGYHVIEDNYIENEAYGGITYEASGGGKNSQIRYNTLVGNGWVSDTITEARIVWSGAVYLYSAAAEIHNNIGIDNRGTVGVFQSPRNNPGNDPYFYSIKGTSVHDNTWKLYPGSRGVTGLKVIDAADWPPYQSFGQSYIDSFTKSATPPVSFVNNTYSDLGSLGPSINYWETGGDDQRFYWGFAMSANIPGSNPDTWAQHMPQDGPFYSGGAPVTTPDTTAPTISITSPIANTVLSGTSTTVQATATDNVGVTKVDFSVDNGTVLSSVTSPPYTYTLNTTTLSNASHTIKAIAYDAAGNNTSTTVTITVNITAPPPTTRKCDFNNDNLINTKDLFILLAKFSMTVPINTNGDCNGSGTVDSKDLFTLLALFGT